MRLKGRMGMKRVVSVLLALLLIPILVACGDGGDEGNDIILQQYFVGRVVEVYEKSCLVEISDPGNQYLSVGEVAVVSTNLSDCPAFAVGDFLRIVFDGKVAESYPPQIFTVYSIQKTDALGRNRD